MSKELSDKMRDAVNEVAVQLAHIRRCSKRDAMYAVADSYRENLRDSHGTADESYWQGMLTVAEELVDAQGQPSLTEGSA